MDAKDCINPKAAINITSVTLALSRCRTMRTDDNFDGARIGEERDFNRIEASCRPLSSVRGNIVPFKFHRKNRHHIPRQRRRVTNWREYEAALRNRGSLTVWFTEEAIAFWRAQPRTTPGGQRHCRSGNRNGADVAGHIWLGPAPDSNPAPRTSRHEQGPAGLHACFRGTSATGQSPGFALFRRRNCHPGGMLIGISARGTRAYRRF